MKALHFAIVSVALTSACIEPPKPRQVAPVTGSPTGEIRKTDDSQTPQKPNTGRVVLAPEGTQVPDPKASPSVGMPGVTATAAVDPAPEATGTAAAVSSGSPEPTSTAGVSPPIVATQPPAPTLNVFVDFAGGYFRNCISYRLAGQSNWTLLGCTKTNPSSSTVCVGTDTAFQLKTNALAVNASLSRQVVGIKVDTYKNSAVCNAQNGTFTYPVPSAPLGAQHWAMATWETNRKTRFRCTKTATRGQNKIVLRYEDAVSPDASDLNSFRDLHIVLTAQGTDVGLEGLDVCTDPS